MLRSSNSGKQKAYLAGLAEGGAIDFARAAAADVADDELEGAADGGVGTVALAEDVHAVVHADAVADGAVDDDDRAWGSGWWRGRRAC